MGTDLTLLSKAELRRFEDQQIFKTIARKPKSVLVIADELDLPAPDVSLVLRRLKRAGKVEAVRFTSRPVWRHVSGARL